MKSIWTVTFGKADAQRADIDRAILRFVNRVGEKRYGNISTDARGILGTRVNDIKEETKTTLIKKMLSGNEYAQDMFARLTEKRMPLTQIQVFQLIKNNKEEYLRDYPAEDWKMLAAVLANRPDWAIRQRYWAEPLVKYYEGRSFEMFKKRGVFSDILTANKNCPQEIFAYICNVTGASPVSNEQYNKRVGKFIVDKEKADYYLKEYTALKDAETKSREAENE